MKLIYSGKTQEFTPALEKKVSTKLAKLGKLVDKRGEREAHVIHNVERHLHKVEIVMNVYDHSLVGAGADGDLSTSLNAAIEKLEKQVVKMRARWRDTHRDQKSVRDGKENWTDAVPEPVAISAKPAGKAETKKPAVAKALAARNGRPKIFHVNYDEDRKPMTLDEALLEISHGEHYVVYRDAAKSCLSVLIRRPDGHLDLVQS